MAHLQNLLPNDTIVKDRFAVNFAQALYVVNTVRSFLSMVEVLVFGGNLEDRNPASCSLAYYGLV
ncbi:hypothetical protein M378DRAFT_163817 [Amanita muscaria Koide BX008]|uniref:Uncharacterized protein n=1 Tax=Amanita muscaria (strain Koide BX008) TaxID=946122 RepID=A0A0C2X588_AMAMK|nr:hypothetical protein M378DRAFT_163817 [Amanita muscaria Koide BX008]